MDSQYVNITFSCNIPAVKHYNGFHGLVVNLGDLDGNKTDEIMYYPDWVLGNWAGVFIYGYRKNKWTLFGSGSVRRDVIFEKKDPIKFLKNRVKKIDNKSFNFTEHIWREQKEGDDLIVDTVVTITIK